MTPPLVDPATIKAGEDALVVVSRPSVFQALVALACMFGLGYMIYDNGKRADRQVEIMQRMVDRLDEIDRKIDVLTGYGNPVPPRVQTRGKDKN